MFAVGAVAVLGMMAVEEEERVRRPAPNRQLRMERRLLRDAANPYEVDPEHFRRYYRMPPHFVMDLVELLRDHISRESSVTIDPHLQVLAALRFFAEGTYQKGGGQDYNHPLSQTAMSRCIDGVVNAIVNIADQFIKFPQTRAELQQVQRRFLEHIRIPGIVGIIDCLLVSLIRSVENEEAFYNYKGYHALNVQIICDADYIIRDIRICPGSNNDRQVYRFSDAKQFLENLRRNEAFTREEGRFYIIGDDGYTPSPVLLTPVRNPAIGSRDERYNNEFVRTRCKVEQLNGIFTAVFRCIKRERKLCYRDPEKVSKIITASAVLHNFRKTHGLNQENFDEDVIENDEEGLVDGDFGYQAGIAERDRIIRQYYH